MALFYEVTYKMKPGKRAEFIQKIIENKIAELSRAEAGNSKYEYICPAEDKDILRLNEIWADKTAQQGHTQMEHFKLLSSLKPEYVEETKMQITEIEFVDGLN